MNSVTDDARRKPLRKRMAVAALVLILISPLFHVPAAEAAQTTWKQSGDWMYYVEDNGAVLGGYKGNKVKVSIPSKLDGYKVKKLSYYVFADTKVKSVTVPATVESIEPLTFFIGMDSDHYMREGILHTINVSKKNKHFTSVNGVLFSKNKKTLLTYPQAKTAAEYKIPAGVEKIGAFAFENNRNLKKVTFPSSVRRMESYAFAICKRLETVSLNTGLKYMGSLSFMDCINIKKITIPKTVVDMDTDNPMFLGAEKLESINVHPQNPYYSSKAGVLFDKKMKRMYEYPHGKKTASYNVPSTVEILSGMGYNGYLKELTLAPSVHTIEDSALKSAYSLRKVKMTSHLKKIGTDAFSKCKSLQAVTIPKSVAFLGESAFEYCDKLKKIVFKTKDCTFFPNNTVIPENTIIYGYSKSTAYQYAKNYGRVFVDVDSKKETSYKYDADKLIRLLPTSKDLDYGEPASSTISYRDPNGNFNGYQPGIIHEYDTSRKEYQELKLFTAQLVKNCSTDKEKIETISNWVHENMTYVLGSMSGNSIESVYMLFKRLYGNCMCFTQLTNYMLYLQGIPSASIIVPGHELGAAFDGKQWYVVDSTNGYIGTSMQEGSGVIECITFTSGQLTFDIRNTEGIYLGAVGYDQADQQTIRSITIPSYVKGIYSSVLSTLPKNVTVKGERGGQVEKYCKKIYKYITYSGNQFSATNTAGNGDGSRPDKDEDSAKLGTKVTKNNIIYKVTKKASTQKPGTVSCISYTNGLNGKVKIPSSVKINGYSYQVTAIAAKAFQDNRKITDVVLPEKIRTIGSYAFARCSKLKRLAVPAQVAKIGAYAFKGDKNLKKLTVESGKLTKNNVKKSLAGSSLHTIQLTQAAKNKKTSYKKIFAASNSGRKVTIR